MKNIITFIVIVTFLWSNIVWAGGGMSSDTLAPKSNLPALYLPVQVDILAREALRALDKEGVRDNRTLYLKRQRIEKEIGKVMKGAGDKIRFLVFPDLDRTNERAYYVFNMDEDYYIRITTEKYVKDRFQDILNNIDEPRAGGIKEVDEYYYEVFVITQRIKPFILECLEKIYPIVKPPEVEAENGKPPMDKKRFLQEPNNVCNPDIWEKYKFSYGRFIGDSFKALREMKEPVKVSIVVPMHKEEVRLRPRSPENPYGEDAFRRKVLQLEVCRLINPLLEWELIFVDNGTPEGASGKLVERLWKDVQEECNGYGIKLNPEQVKVLYITPEEAKQMGSIKGGAVYRGIQYAINPSPFPLPRGERADIIFYTDTDISVDLRQIGLLLEPIVNREYDVAIGSRWLKESLRDKKTIIDIVASRLYNMVVRLLLPLGNIKDTQCGFKAFRKELLEKVIPYASDYGFSFDTELLTLSKTIGSRVEEVPIAWFGSSVETKVDLLRDAVRMILGLWRQRQFFYRTGIKVKLEPENINVRSFIKCLCLKETAINLPVEERLDLLSKSLSILLKRNDAEDIADELRISLIAYKEELLPEARMMIESYLGIYEIKDPITIAVCIALWKGQEDFIDKPGRSGWLSTKVNQLFRELLSINPKVDGIMVFVNDGDDSEDGKKTSDVIRELLKGEEYEDVKDKIYVLDLSQEDKQEMGSIKHGALACGMGFSAGIGVDLIMYTDSDLSSHLGLSGLLVDSIINTHNDAAFGSIRKKDAVVPYRAFWRDLGTVIYNWWVRLLLRPIRGIKDTQRSFKAFRRDVLERILPVKFEAIDENGELKIKFNKNFMYDFTGDTEWLARAKILDYKHDEIPIVWIDSPETSTVDFWKQVIPMFISAWRQRRNLGIFKENISNQKNSPSCPTDVGASIYNGLWQIMIRLLKALKAILNQLSSYSPSFGHIKIPPIVKAKIINIKTVVTQIPYLRKSSFANAAAIIIFSISIIVFATNSLLLVVNIALLSIIVFGFILLDNNGSVKSNILSLYPEEISWVRGHAKRVARLAEIIAKRMRLDNEIVEMAYIGGFAHDLGKGSSREMIDAVNSTKEIDKDIVRKHPEESINILNKSGIDVNNIIKTAILYHHIPCLIEDEDARIVAEIIYAADEIDASQDINRPYKEGVVDLETLKKELMKSYKEGIISNITYQTVSCLLDEKQGDFINVIREARGEALVDMHKEVTTPPEQRTYSFRSFINLNPRKLMRVYTGLIESERGYPLTDSESSWLKGFSRLFRRSNKRYYANSNVYGAETFADLRWLLENSTEYEQNFPGVCYDSMEGLSKILTRKKIPHLLVTTYPEYEQGKKRIPQNFIILNILGVEFILDTTYENYTDEVSGVILLPLEFVKRHKKWEDKVYMYTKWNRVIEISKDSEGETVNYKISSSILSNRLIMGGDEIDKIEFRWEDNHEQYEIQLLRHKEWGDINFIILKEWINGKITLLYGKNLSESSLENIENVERVETKKIGKGTIEIKVYLEDGSEKILKAEKNMHRGKVDELKETHPALDVAANTGRMFALDIETARDIKKFFYLDDDDLVNIFLGFLENLDNPGETRGKMLSRLRDPIFRHNLIEGFQMMYDAIKDQPLPKDKPIRLCIVIEDEDLPTIVFKDPFNNLISHSGRGEKTKKKKTKKIPYISIYAGYNSIKVAIARKMEEGFRELVEHELKDIIRGYHVDDYPAIVDEFYNKVIISAKPLVEIPSQAFLYHYRTSFFRNMPHYKWLREIVLPRVSPDKEKYIKIAILGCSTGQEPISIAIWLLENGYKDFEIVSIDRNPQVLEKFENGIYTQKEMNRFIIYGSEVFDYSGEDMRAMINKYFQYSPEDSTYTLREELRDRLRNKVLSDITIKGNIQKAVGRVDILFYSNIAYRYEEPAHTVVAEEISRVSDWVFVSTKKYEAMKRLTERYGLPIRRKWFYSLFWKVFKGLSQEWQERIKDPFDEFTEHSIDILFDRLKGYTEEEIRYWIDIFNVIFRNNKEALWGKFQHEVADMIEKVITYIARAKEDLIKRYGPGLLSGIKDIKIVERDEPTSLDSIARIGIERTRHRLLVEDRLLYEAVHEILGLIIPDKPELTEVVATSYRVRWFSELSQEEQEVLIEFGYTPRAELKGIDLNEIKKTETALQEILLLFNELIRAKGGGDIEGESIRVIKTFNNIRIEGRDIPRNVRRTIGFVARWMDIIQGMRLDLLPSDLSKKYYVLVDKDRFKEYKDTIDEVSKKWNVDFITKIPKGVSEKEIIVLVDPEDGDKWRGLGYKLYLPLPYMRLSFILAAELATTQAELKDTNVFRFTKGFYENFLDVPLKDDEVLTWFFRPWMLKDKLLKLKEELDVVRFGIKGLENSA